MMKCKKVRYLLPEYMERTLPDEEMSLVAQHLHSCDGCSQDLKSIQKLYSTLDHQLQEEPPKDYWVSLLPRIHQRIEERKRRIVPGWVFRYAVPLAGVALLLFILFRIISPGTMTQDQSPVNRSVASTLGVQELIQGMDSVEVEQIADRSSIQMFDNISEPNNTENRLAGDKEVLKELAASSTDLYAALDVEMQSIQENFDDRDIDDILTQLNQKQFIN